MSYWRPFTFSVLAIVLCISCFTNEFGESAWRLAKCGDLVGVRGLPSDLCTEWRNLIALRLPSDTKNLSWMTGGNLQRLSVQDAEILDSGYLPSSLRYLSLRGTSLSLDSLPPRLRTLDLLQAEAGLQQQKIPSQLEALAVSDVKPETMRDLPRSLRCLHIKQNAPNREIKDLTDLAHLSNLKWLKLEGSRILGVEGLPGSVEHLSLISPSTKYVTLPTGLVSLELELSNSQFTGDMGQRLASQLEVWDWPFGDRGFEEVAPFLSELQVATYSDGMGRLPRTLVHLSLIKDVLELPSLPATLERLSVNASSLSQEKLADAIWGLDLTHLELEGFPENELPLLPESLRSLDISWSKVRDLPRLPQLEKLNLTGVDPGYGLLRLPDIAELTWSNFPKEKFVTLPENVVYLNVSRSGVLATLPDLPTGLRHLDISNTAISNLNFERLRNLEWLDASGSHLRIDFRTLPPSLETLIVSEEQLDLLAGRPEKLKTIEFHYSGDVRHVPFECPGSFNG